MEKWQELNNKRHEISKFYYGFSKVSDVSGWKERNIKRLHLVAGILLFLVGLALLIGWL